LSGDQSAPLVTGIGLAFVHLINTLDQKGIVSRSELAASYRATAYNLSPEIRDWEIVAFVLTAIARGIETFPVAPPPHAERQPLH
jgi:hypothetical protein